MENFVRIFCMNRKQGHTSRTRDENTNAGRGGESAAASEGGGIVSQEFLFKLETLNTYVAD